MATRIGLASASLGTQPRVGDRVPTALEALEDIVEVRTPHRGVGACASCGGVAGLEPYGAIAFCRDCREQAEQFAAKDLYCDMGGGD